MDKIKNKYEIILGLVTLVISLSAFKEELSEVSLVLGYTTITLAEYFLLVVYGFSICLYFYIIENVARDTRIGKWKFFDYILYFAYFLFAFILSTPIIIIVNIIIYKVIIIISNNINESKTIFALILNLISVTISSIISIYATKQYLKERKNKTLDRIEEEEIKVLDNASKLFSDGYYSHSVLETFKVIESHLYKEIIKKNIRVQRSRFSELIQIALKEEIIKQEDALSINDIRGMRNAAAHSDTQYTKQQAEFAMKFARQLITRSDEN